MKSPTIFIISLALLSLNLTAAFSSSCQTIDELPAEDSLEFDKQILLEFIQAVDKPDNPYPYHPENWSSDHELTNEWEGVTISNDRVVALVLPRIYGAADERMLEGDIPASLAHLTKLKKLDLSDNELRYLPDLSGLEELDSIDISGNRLGFESIVPNLSVAAYYEYSPQRRFGHSIYDTIPAGEAYTLMVDHDFPGTNYQWAFGELIPGAFYNNDVTDIPGATTHDLVLDSVVYDQAGTYRVKMTHPHVPDLVIESRNININLWAYAGVSGNVFVDDSASPMVAGEVIAYRVTPAGPYVPEDTVQVIGGEFQFENLILGDFVFLAKPDRNTYPLDTSPGNALLVPTYFGDAYRYQDAEVVEVRGSVDTLSMKVLNHDVSVIEGTHLLTGDLLYDFYEDPFSDSTPVQENGRMMNTDCEPSAFSVKQSEGPRNRALARKRAVGVPCFLLRYVGGSGDGSDISDYEIYAYDETGEDGIFYFEGVLDGFYRLEIQYPGVPMDLYGDILFEVGGDFEYQIFVIRSVVNEDAIQVEAEPLLSVDESESQFKLFPNPTSGEVRLRLNNNSKRQTLSLQIYNLDGKLMAKTGSKDLHSDEVQIDVSDLPSGIYVLQVSADSGQVLFKERIVKQ